MGGLGIGGRRACFYKLGMHVYTILSFDKLPAMPMAVPDKQDERLI